MEDSFAKARSFLFSNARLLERHLFRYLFEEGPADLVANAVKAYQNPDGGFGHALEPDKRTPSSQPIDVEFAFKLLDEIERMDDPVVERACDFLLSISNPDGGIPFSLPSARAYPHAAWWAAEDDPPSSINPTASIAALLLKNGVEHPWLDQAADYCWREIRATETTSFHDLMPIISFLDQSPNYEAAASELQRVASRIRDEALIEENPDATGYVKMPLDWAPTPDSFCRRLIPKETLVVHLEALLRKQQPDGGWPISWQPISLAVELEWRGIVTIQALQTLHSYRDAGVA